MAQTPATRSRRQPADIFSELDRVTSQLASNFPDWGSMFGGGQEDVYRPVADLEETENAYILDIELPGVPKDQTSVSVEQRRVVVDAQRPERQREESGVYHVRGRSGGRFHFEAQLPGDVAEEQVSAELEQGLLTVNLPKTPQATSRKVEIR